MHQRSTQIVTYVLAILVAFSFVANTASALEACMPKACCCQKAAHAVNTGLHDKADVGCNGNGPCCEIQPSLPFPDMAIVAAPDTPLPKPSNIAGVPSHYSAETQLARFPAFSFTGVNLKIPLPPIYLQNQSFLC